MGFARKAADDRMKRRKVKIGFALAAGVIVVLAMAIVGMAWIKGGVQPAQTVEIPVQVASPGAGA
jgi:hypothetical protein